MAKLRNTFDGGTNGTGMTVANTGGASGDAFAAVVVDAIFSNEWFETSPLSMKPPLTAAAGYGRWNTVSRNSRHRVYFMVTGAITSDYNFLQLRINSATSVLTLRVNSAGILRVFAHAASANVWTASTALPYNQTIRAELLVEQGVANNDGRVKVAYYLGDSLTPIQESAWLTAINLRGDVGSIGETYIGKVQTTANAAALYLDTVAVDTDSDYATTFIGPDVPPASVAPAYRWNGAAYVALDSYRWDGAAYVSLDRATP